MAKTVGKKGTCLNIGNCEKANSKESIIIKIGDDFICPDCGCELIEIKKESGNKLPLIIGAGGLIIVAIAVAAYFLVFMDTEENEKKFVDTTWIEPLPSEKEEKEEIQKPVEEEIVPEKGVKTELKVEKTQITTTPQNLTVKSGSYKGESKNGKPHGQGTLTYNSRTRISVKDMKERYAEAGQYLSGEFYDGEVVTGKLYDKNNEQIESIIVGR